MSLLAGTDWHGRIYSGGWSDGTGGTRAVVSPSSGQEIGTIGLASADDVAAAAVAATEAQRAWAALPYNERAAVLRRAGDLWHAHAEEITDWLMRETGAIGPFGGFQIMTSAEECYEAAALASAPYGELLRSSSPRLSMSRRVPVGVVGVISPFNVPTILSIRAVAPGARARERGAAQARSSDVGVGRRDPRRALLGRRAPRRRAPRPSRRRRRRAPPSSPTLTSAWCPSPGPPPRGARSGSSPRSISSASTSSSAATPRCSSWTTWTSMRRPPSVPGARSPTRDRSA